MRRCGAGVFLVVLLAVLAGCFLFEDEPVLNAVIAPAQGIIPYQAQIVATAPTGGTFTFELPGETIVQEDNVLDVTVDTLTWSATVTWSDGKSLRSTVVTATASNPRPIIHRPLINGIASVWHLEPRERTLIEFHYHPASMTSPTTGIEYAGPWQIREIRVECSEKLLCDQPVPDSIYCPPYEDGVYHALVNGSVRENACIVYPTLTYETDSAGKPYAPAQESGYAVDTVQNRNVFDGVSYPEQTAVIRVVVEDEFGRLTVGSFEIPLEAALYRKQSPLFEQASYYVAGVRSAFYAPSWCDEVCSIPPEDRLYFADERHASDSGRDLDPSCSQEQPSSIQH